MSSFTWGRVQGTQTIPWTLGSCRFWRFFFGGGGLLESSGYQLEMTFRKLGIWILGSDSLQIWRGKSDTSMIIYAPPKKMKDQWAWNWKTGQSVSDVSCLSLKRHNCCFTTFLIAQVAKKIKTYVCRYTTRHLSHIYILIYIYMQKWYLDSFPKPGKFINFNSRPSWFRSLENSFSRNGM